MFCVETAFWTGAFYAITGGIGFIASQSQKPSKCLIISFTLLSLFSSIFALPLIIFSANEFVSNSDEGFRIMFGIQMMTGICQGIVTIFIFVYTIKATCSSSSHYESNIVFTAQEQESKNPQSLSATEKRKVENEALLFAYFNL